MSESDQFLRYAEETLLGLLKPRPMRRSAFCSRWRTHGPKRQSQARQLAAAPRQSAGHRRAVAGGGLVARSSHRSSLPVFTDDLESTCRSGKPHLAPRRK